MRFLNTTTLRFEEVPDSDLHLERNQYAILSHRWGRDEDEVTYQDILASDDGTGKIGFAKIKEFCKLALLEDCQYGWVDTCCINKGNSAELTEAINSMYLWYKCSKTCIAYLKDVPPQQDFTKSEWFDRGWTLQELVAPKVVCFFDQTWQLIGKKTELLDSLSRRTRIPRDVLSHAAKSSDCSVAQRMSWAADRVTTRVEDRAYSLLGLFDVHMPMIYGEREKSFLRLQQNIIAMCKDESIFAWAMEQSDDRTKTYSGLYAPSPSVYRDCGSLVATAGSAGFTERNGELLLTTELLPYTPGTYRAMLHCADPTRHKSRVGIMIAQWQDGPSTGFVRVMRPNHPSQRSFPRSRLMEETIIFPINPSEPKVPVVPIYCGFWLRTLQPPGYADCDVTVLSRCPVSDPNFISQDYHSQGNTGVVRLKPKLDHERPLWSQIRWIKFGFSKTFRPIVWLANDTHSHRLDNSFELALGHPESKSYTQTMSYDRLDNSQGELQRGLYYEWPEGQVLLRTSEAVPETARQVFVIHEINLTVSIQLKPFQGSGFLSASRDEGKRLPVTPMMVWTIDMTKTNQSITSVPQEKENSTPIAVGTHPVELFFLYLCCWPWVCLICCCNPEEDKDGYYPRDVARQRQVERNQLKSDKAKAEYELGAASRLPVFNNPQVIFEAAS